MGKYLTPLPAVLRSKGTPGQILDGGLLPFSMNYQNGLSKVAAWRTADFARRLCPFVLQVNMQCDKLVASPLPPQKGTCSLEASYLPVQTWSKSGQAGISVPPASTSDLSLAETFYFDPLNKKAE